jgi:hypothetical protein
MQLNFKLRIANRGLGRAKGEEDPDPLKAEQYKRWGQLRKLQQQNEKNSPAPSPN